MLSDIGSTTFVDVKKEHSAMIEVNPIETESKTLLMRLDQGVPKARARPPPRPLQRRPYRWNVLVLGLPKQDSAFSGVAYEGQAGASLIVKAARATPLAHPHAATKPACF